jgi:peptidyl-prolyl cis-trans isomerase D
MSIIQTIRDKGTWVIFILLGLSLISFIFMDAGKRGSIFGGGNENPSIGSINGTNIKSREFNGMAEALTIAVGNEQNTKDKIQDQLWNILSNYESMKSELAPFDNGLDDKALTDIAIGKYGQPMPFVTQLFSKAYGEQLVQQGQLNIPQAELALKQLRANKNNKNTNDESKKFLMNFDALLPLVKILHLQNKHNTLMNVTNYVPEWLASKKIAENSSYANVSYVTYPYVEVTDTNNVELKVTDADINNYIGKNKNAYKTIDSRSIDYTTFSYAPTAGDSAAIIASMEDKRNKFIATTNDTTVYNFLNNNNTQVNYNNNYVRKSEVTIKDSSAGLAKDIVTKIYIDANNYVMAKVVDVKQYADTASARHILLLTVNPQTGERVLADSIAEIRMDSINNAIKNGASFDSLAKRYSQDPSSKDSGGLVKNISFNQVFIDAKFNDFIFSNPSGATTIIKSNLGYQLVKAESTKGTVKAAYKIAYLAKEIIPSTATKENIFNIATQFAGNNNTGASFQDYFTKNASQLKMNGYNITRENQNIAGINDDTKEMCKWAFEAKVNAVSGAFDLNKTYKYAVANLISKMDEGYFSAADIRKNNPQIINQLLSEKKYTYLAKKYPTATSIEDIATKMGKQVVVKDSISYQSGVIPNVSPEQRVVGAAFNPTNLNKVSGPIRGTTGLFYIKTNSAPYTVANPIATVKDLQKQLEQQQGSLFQQKGMQVFKNNATIKDKRLENGY